jgi:Kef-type K+ transport system membrane component KefB
MRKSVYYVVGLLLVVVLMGFVPWQEDAPDHKPSAGHSDPVAPVLLAVTVILVTAKLGGELFERMKQPAVLGELVFGVILGNLMLVNAGWDFFGPLRAEYITEHWAIAVDNLARIGVILLLFEVGLESNVAEMRKVGVSSFLVAVVGVVVPFILGYGSSAVFIKEVPRVILDLNPSFDINNIHLFIGATLCATSVGITARVFKDLDRLQTKEARIILGAAVIDDVLGLIILAIAAGIVVAAETGIPLEMTALLQIAGVAIGFLVGAIILGLVFIPKVMKSLSKLRTHGIMLISSLLFCFIVSYLANVAGLAPIVGAFAAGLILEEVHFTEFREKKKLHDLLIPVTTFLVPIFFVVMGIQVRLETFMRFDVIGLAVALTIAAFIGKQVCGLAVVEKGLDRLTVGVGMVPRGEVGLIFASIGKGLGVVDDAIFSAIIIMVIATTLVTPPLLKFTLARAEKKRQAAKT